MTDSLTVHHIHEEHPDLRLPDPHQDEFSKTYLGFWIYLMTDCILFTTLFITYAVLHPNTFGGPSSKDIFSIPLVLSETIILLVSSATCGLAVLSAVNNKIKHIFFWLTVTWILGGAFLFIEISEFSNLVSEGHSWKASAFLSSFFTLVGTHGAHITTGLVWMIVLTCQLLYQGLNVDTFRRLTLFSLFWHFLDLIWIFIFTFVYLKGVV